MTALPHSFGLAVRHLREARGWSQEALSEKADLNRSYVGEVERGEAIASLLTLEKLACAFKLSPSVLLAQSEQMRLAQHARGRRLLAIAG